MGGSSQIKRDEREELRSALYERTRPSPTLVVLRGGNSGVPVFLAPGLGNDMRDLYPLAQLLVPPSPVYGLQPRGSNGVEEPERTIEAMAETHLADILGVQAKGPYVLIGYSLGGLVMLEIARRLRERNEEIALLAMLDSYPYRDFLPLFERLPLLGRLGSRKILRSIGFAGPHPQAKVVRDGRDPVDQALKRIEAAQDTAWYGYRPRCYEGRVRYIETAEKMEYFPRHPRAVWTRWTGELTVETVPGNHGDMIHAQAPKVAEVLSRYLRELGA